MLRSWPTDAIEHELRSLRKFLMRFEEAPPVVRIHHTEAGFKRPELAISMVAAGRTTLGNRFQTLSRAAVVAWYGDSNEEAAWQVASWLTTALTSQEGEMNGGAIRLYDFSTTPLALVPRVAIEVEQDSVNATVLPNPVNNWSVNVDLRWQVRMGVNPRRQDVYPPTALPDGPVVTAIPFKIEIGG